MWLLSCSLPAESAEIDRSTARRGTQATQQTEVTSQPLERESTEKWNWQRPRGKIAVEAR